MTNNDDDKTTTTTNNDKENNDYDRRPRQRQTTSTTTTTTRTTTITTNDLDSHRLRASSSGFEQVRASSSVCGWWLWQFRDCGSLARITLTLVQIILLFATFDALLLHQHACTQQVFVVKQNIWVTLLSYVLFAMACCNSLFSNFIEFQMRFGRLSNVWQFIVAK
jgi:hypothetical protein